MDGITLRRHGGDGTDVGTVAEIILDRPDAMNALSTAMAERIAAVCGQVAGDPAIRAVLLTGAGERAFCVGADLKERNQMSEADFARQRPVFRRAFGGIRDLPQPTVAAVHGYALGGGCEFALSCDLIVADETAVFGLPETAVGLVPGGGGTQLALRKLGPGRALDLVLTGRRVVAAEAYRIGLADRLVPAGAARHEAVNLAGQIAAHSPVAVRAAKQAIRNGAGTGLAAGLDIEDAAWRTAVFSADRKEGIAAFNEKRRPQWPAE